MKSDIARFEPHNAYYKKIFDKEGFSCCKITSNRIHNYNIILIKEK